MPTHNPQPTISATRLGGSADVRALPDQPVSGTGEASQAGLFPAETSLPIASGGVPPSRLDFNAILAQLGATQYYLQHGGVFGYAAAVSYDAGALVSYGGSLYMALQANGADETAGVVTPGTDADVWMELGSGTGAWSVDRPIRIGDHDSTHFGTTYQLNEGSSLLTLTLPGRMHAQEVSGSRTVGENTAYGYDLYCWDTFGPTLVLSYENSNGNQRTATEATYDKVRLIYRGVTTNYTPWKCVSSQLEDSGMYKGHCTMSAVYWTEGSDSGYYYTGWQLGLEHCQLWVSATNSFAPGGSGGSLPPSFSDSTVAAKNGDGDDITLTQVGYTRPCLDRNGVRWGGYNTVGSTIMAARHTTTGDTANNYGALVAGSDLCWAGWDTDGGGVNQSAAGDLGLSGTWVKCSGQATTHGGTNGMGLYRRVL